MIDKSEEYISLQSDRTNKYYYQIELANLIKYKLLDSNKTAGMLVLPTGGGKTRVAVTAALDKAMKDGYKIFWIAHRHMLLEQAEQTFYEFSKLSNRDLSIKVISGKHNSIQSLSDTDDIILISNMSMGIHEKDEKDKKYDGLIRQTLKQKIFTKEQKWLIVVDEAHHSIASSYKEWIAPKKGWLRRYRRDNIKILGLTATPNFISEEGDVAKEDEDRTKELSYLFDDNLISTTSTQKLIEKQILSLPNFITIDTQVELDAEEILKRVSNTKGSLSNPILEKELNKEIAKHEGRNRLIVATYLNGHKNIDFTQNPTLIFASNIIQAITLKESFLSKNVFADTIYSGNKNNDEIIEKFKNGTLKILINVEILTEGSDIPQIQNLFIARITGSKVLYRQMVGRALRGKDSGGTRTANIVTFRDNILNYHKDFFNAQKLKKGLFSETKKTPKAQNIGTTTITEDEIKKAHEKFKNLKGKNSKIEFSSAIASGYYDLNEVEKRVSVYEHQEESYRNFLVAYKDDNTIIESNIDTIKSIYFKSENMLFDVLEEDLKELVEYIKHLHTIPDFVRYEFKNYLEEELQNIAMKYTSNIVFATLKKDYDDSKYVHKFYSYIDFEEQCINFIKRYRHYLNQPIKTIELEEEEYPEFTFDATKHNRKTIFQNAKQEILRVLKRKKLKNAPTEFEWEDKAIRSWWGYADSIVNDFTKPESKRIRINKILQLKEIPSKVIEFVVYHELLHHELENYTHDKEFKRYEAMFPDFVYCEEVLYQIARSNIENIIVNIGAVKNWSLYDENKIFTIDEVKEIVEKENIVMPTLTELKNIVTEESLFFRRDVKDAPLFYLADDFISSFSSFRVESGINNRNKYMLIIAKDY